MKFLRVSLVAWELRKTLSRDVVITSDGRRGEGRGHLMNLELNLRNVADVTDFANITNFVSERHSLVRPVPAEDTG